MSPRTLSAPCIVRQVQEKNLEKQKKTFYAFLNLEKAYDKVPRDVISRCLRRTGVPEALVKMVKATYKEATTRMMTHYGDTEEFRIDVGLHQGSALSPFLFVTIMEVLTERARKGLPWELMM